MAAAGELGLEGLQNPDGSHLSASLGEFADKSAHFAQHVGFVGAKDVMTGVRQSDHVSLADSVFEGFGLRSGRRLIASLHFGAHRRVADCRSQVMR